MKLQLNVFERLLLRNIVPQIQGWNFGSQESARVLLESMFSEDEEEDLQFEQEGTQVKWKIAKEDGTPITQAKECPVSKGLKAKIGKFLIELNNADPPKLGFEHNTLFKKFVDGWEDYLETDDASPSEG
uniref:Uncharacterized protein n=1 Tax=viral metagenome TaxID=1070528 RepID=A0A6M3JWJ1_9ZZZZ